MMKKGLFSMNRTTALLISSYLAAIVAANLSIAHFGPKAAIVNAIIFIGADLVLRDRLHDAFGKGRSLVYRMGALIATGSLLSYAVSLWVTPSFLNVGRIALASGLAFGGAAIADGIVYQLRRKQSWADRANESNLAGAAVDSILFPAIAFGLPLSWTFVLTLWSAKVAGGYVFSLILRKRTKCDVPGCKIDHTPAR